MSGPAKNIVIIISGRGSNMEAIYKASEQEEWLGKYGIRISAVISNRPEAPGLKFAQEKGIPTEIVDHKAFSDKSEFEDALSEACIRHRADLIVLAGFMRILTGRFISRFAGRILNIHPAILPLFPGLHTHERALEAGVRIHGATVHYVTEEVDGGGIIGQSAVKVLADDTPDLLGARVLKTEHQLYPRAVRLVATGSVTLSEVDGKVCLSKKASEELAIFGSSEN